MVPDSVPSDAHVAMAAMFWVPLIDRRQAALVDEALQFGQADALQFEGWAALGHASVIASTRSR